MSGRKRQSIFLSILLIVTIMIMIFIGSCSQKTSNLNVFAAAGAKPAIDRVYQEFQEKSGITMDVSYGGGGEVLSQMMLSRCGDIYIAPEQKFIEMAVEAQVIDPETIRTVAYMIPVIVVQKGNPKNIQTLADLARPGIKVAVTRQETTLLGKYAPEIFAKEGLAEEIGENIVTVAVRPDNLLTMLVMGQVDAGILWHFYGIQDSNRIENVYLLPAQLTGIGEMQIALTVFCRNTNKALEFFDFIDSAEGKAIFQQQGYLVNTEEVEEYWE